MNTECVTEDRISFKDVLKKIKSEPKHLAPKPVKYPKGQDEAPVYTEIPLYYRAEDETPTSEIKAYMYVLTCPICGNKVKRSHAYCEECGNHLVESKL